MAKYKWFLTCDDGTFNHEDESGKTFDTELDAYNDMRNAALEKMKWNTNLDEDFGDVDDDSFIGYEVHFFKDCIIHKSYSGTYTYQIEKVVNPRIERMDIDADKLRACFEKLDSASDCFNDTEREFDYDVAMNDLWGTIAQVKEYLAEMCDDNQIDGERYNVGEYIK